MKKELITTVCTFAVAGAIILGNAGIVASAKINNETEVSAEKLNQPTVTTQEETSQESKVTISKMNDSPAMAAKKTSEDMDKEKATNIALETLEKKFNVSLDGTYATPILCERTDYDGLVYFVSFVDLKNAPKNDNKLGSDNKTDEAGDVYIAFLDAKSGKVIAAEKNPVGTETN